MKKVLALSLTVILCFSLCTCGEDTSNKTPELRETIEGTWIREYEFEGTNYITTIEIYKGGTGTFGTVEIGEEKKQEKITWEIVDDVLNIKFSDIFGERVMGFIYKSESGVENLEQVDGSRTYYRQPTE